jgi:hypothetical protein
MFMLDQLSAILAPRDQSLDIEAIIVCVNYADFLRITLPITKDIFESITIATSPNDVETISVAREHGIGIHITEVWHENGARFNKAAALNECLGRIGATKTDCWILLLDADILFNANILPDISNLDTRGLYSIRRRICATKREWDCFKSGSLKWNDFPLSVPPIRKGRAWGQFPTSNPAALQGYVQLWNMKHAVGMKQLPLSNNAAEYDVKFALSFPETLRRFLENREVLHLGPIRTNWDGRASARW